MTNVQSNFPLKDKPEALKLVEQFLGKPFILYFYPKDDTPGCTQQACELLTHLKQFQDKGYLVAGVSKDSSKSHEKFISKYNLTFPLLSDENGHLCDAFGVWVEKSMYGKKYFGIERSTFILDSSGCIQKEFRKVKVPKHWESVLKTIETFPTI